MARSSGLTGRKKREVGSEEVRREEAGGGYTLIETLVALTVLLVVAVPLVAYLYRITEAFDHEKRLTGICIIEQEAALARTFPEKQVPVKRKIIEGREWTITTEVSGSELLKYRMTVRDGKKERGEAVFHVRKQDR